MRQDMREKKNEDNKINIFNLTNTGDVGALMCKFDAFFYCTGTNALTLACKKMLTFFFFFLMITFIILNKKRRFIS